MAIFRRKDRAKRKIQKPLHATAMWRARGAFYYSDASPEGAVKAAWDEYVWACNQFAIKPVTLSAFKKELPDG